MILGSVLGWILAKKLNFGQDFCNEILHEILEGKKLQKFRKLRGPAAGAEVCGNQKRQLADTAFHTPAPCQRQGRRI